MPDLQTLIDFWNANRLTIVLGIISGILVAVIVLVFTGLWRALINAAKWLLRIGRRRPITLPQGRAFPFVYATSFADLEANISEIVPNLHGDLNIAYQPRLPNELQTQLQSTLDDSRFLVLRGRTGMGKTRECLESIRRIERRTGEDVTILVPQAPFTASFAVPQGVPTNHIVLFLDNLHAPPYYTADRESEGTATSGDFAMWFRECINHFKDYEDFRVIATARDDLPSRDYRDSMRHIRPVLNETGFNEVSLPSWSPGNLDDLIKAMAEWRGITIADDAVAELSRRCASEGTPNYAQLAVSRVEPGNTLTARDVADLPLTFDTLWERTWDERIVPYPERLHLFRALWLLRQAGLIPFEVVAVELAARLCGNRVWWHRRKVRKNLDAIRPWVEHKVVHLDCPDAYLQHQQDVSYAQPGMSEFVGSALRDIFSKASQMAVAELIRYGNFISDYPLGSRRQNLEEAITCYTLALKEYTREAFPVEWAMTQNNLGAAYRNRISGERSENLEEAISHFQSALEVYTREAFPVDWAMTQNNLGAAYGNRISEERSENLEEAISHYQSALEVYTREAFPVEWAMTQNNLGTAYGDRISEERSENLEEAISHYQSALEVYTREAFPVEWAMTQNNLGTAYGDRISEERSENLEEAISHFQSALEVYTREAFPVNWAMTQNNLGNAYGNRISGERSENLEEAISHYQSALEFYTMAGITWYKELVEGNLQILREQLEELMQGEIDS